MSTPTGPPVPTSMRLAELAIAASDAGKSVGLQFRCFPATQLASVWRHHATGLGIDEVLTVFGADDVEGVTRKGLRLVLVPDPALRDRVAWRLELTRKPLEQALSRPAFFCRHGSRGTDMGPSASLVLHGHPDELSSITAFMRSAETSARRPLSTTAVRRAGLHSDLETALARSSLSFHDQTVVGGLLLGACRLRQPHSDELLAGPDEYAEVYELLGQPAVCSADEPADPLATAMVRRANAFLRFKHEGSRSRRQARIDAPPPDRSPWEGIAITRRLLADLGDPSGKPVLQLVEHLLGREDGYPVFRSLCLIDILAEGVNWPHRDLKALCRRLHAWSPKQIRDHFHPLYTAGLITAERPNPNGPWLYRLPEVLQHPRSRFRGMPHPADLPAACPSSGQTELTSEPVLEAEIQPYDRLPSGENHDTA